MLETAAFKIRKNNPGAKTNVKFSGEDLGLVLDFKTGEDPWRSISPAQARAAKVSGKTTIDNDTLTGLMGS